MKTQIPQNIIEEMLRSGNETLISYANENKPKSNFELACEKLGIEPKIPDGLSTQMQAMYQLEQIIKVVNNFIPVDVYNSDKRRYYPVFTIDENGGFVFAYVDSWLTYTGVPAPLLFHSEEIVEQTALDNLDLYKQLNTYQQ